MATEISIGEITADLHTVDSSAPLSHAQLFEVARIVARILQEERAHRARVAAERRITQGVSAERDADAESED